jgi:peptide chain release factor 1
MGGVARTGREDKVRTYNYSQNRVTDHRCGSESNDLDGILGGGPSLEALMDDVREWMIEEEMKALAAAEEEERRKM